MNLAKRPRHNDRVENALDKSLGIEERKRLMGGFYENLFYFLLAVSPIRVMTYKKHI
jgi:hypothetical protein